jgi:glycosyltransferase involved in cell wall biosynthesis
MEKPILSVITVVYNNVKHIERTLLSIIHQTYSSIEFIVIDGASNDGTLAVLEKYKIHFNQFVSEPDKGIYDAMNKGLALAKGDYVIFMNSGDEFYEPQTVEQVFSTQAFADVYYGETEMLDEQLISQGKRRHGAPKKLTLQSFNYGMSVSHQAIYIKRSLTKSYDTKYQLSADIDWILDALTKAKVVVNTNKYVAKYLMGGMSKKRHSQSLIERYHIFEKYYGFFPNLIHHGVIAVKLANYWLAKGKTND